MIFEVRWIDVGREKQKKRRAHRRADVPPEPMEDRELHQSVMKREVTTLVCPERGGWFVDCTLGLGGHTEALLEANDAVRVIGIDRDPEALALAAERLDRFADRVRLLHGDYRDVTVLVASLGISEVSGIVADLGVSSMQLDRAERGFSFQREGPLDMRMDPTRGETAADLVNHLPADELADIIYVFGEEPASRRIARRIVEVRERTPIETTTQLATVVRHAIGGGQWQRRDPATRTFQALRIAVNGELDGLARFVRQAVTLLAPGGRLAVITFHSLEDRAIKHAMRAASKGEAIVDEVDADLEAPERPVAVRLVTPKPVQPDPVEQHRNPRSRSAKLRVCERLADGA